MPEKISTTNLRVAMGWIRDYTLPEFHPKTPEEMKELIEQIYEVEVEDISVIVTYFEEKYDYEGYIGEKIYRENE